MKMNKENKQYKIIIYNDNRDEIIETLHFTYKDEAEQVALIFENIADYDIDCS